ncbi:FecR family protein [Hoeflea olei]|nr:FecR family protein [Hoeflea olei]
MGKRDEQTIDDEALEWFVLLGDEDASDDDRRRFEAWRAADPRHDRAWRELERLWGGLGHRAVADAARAGAHRPGPAVAPIRRADRAPPRLGASRRQGLSVAAAVMLAIAVGWQMTPAGLLADYRSGIGERQTVRLEDNSQVELSSASAMDVSFGPGRRYVTLLAGEAFFTVAPDPQRPFVVRTGQGDITVLGTAFNVRLGDSASVAVAQHTVEVSAAGEAVRVGEGEMVRFGPAGVSAAETADLDAISAWRHDRIVFSDLPLDQVVAELQRYHRGRIQLVGGGMADKRVTAVFDTGRIDAAIGTIAESLGLRVMQVPGLLTLIMPG